MFVDNILLSRKKFLYLYVPTSSFGDTFMQMNLPTLYKSKVQFVNKSDALSAFEFWVRVSVLSAMRYL